jgi:hypothetical protein
MMLIFPFAITGLVKILKKYDKRNRALIRLPFTQNVSYTSLWSSVKPSSPGPIIKMEKKLSTVRQADKPLNPVPPWVATDAFQSFMRLSSWRAWWDRLHLLCKFFVILGDVFVSLVNILLCNLNYSWKCILFLFFVTSYCDTWNTRGGIYFFIIENWTGDRHLFLPVTSIHTLVTGVVPVTSNLIPVTSH